MPLQTDDEASSRLGEAEVGWQEKEEPDRHRKRELAVRIRAERAHEVDGQPQSKERWHDLRDDGQRCIAPDSVALG